MTNPSSLPSSSSSPSPSAEPLILAQNLTKSFWLDHRRIDVLQGIDLTVQRGERIAIVGASGAGKSTFLHLLGTLDLPSSGSLRIAGIDVLSHSEDDLAHLRNRTIGFVFQAHYLLPEFSALENVMMPALIQRLSRQEARDQAEELLAWVGLQERLDHRPGELSGGERQRVALCRALIMRPSLLLADEPTGNLDQRTGAGIHELLVELNQRWQITLIAVTHNLSLARQMQTVLRLDRGHLAPTDVSGEQELDRKTP